MIWYLPIARESLAGQPQGWAIPAFPGAEPLGLSSDIVARHRHHALAFRGLQLENHHGLLAKGHLGRGKIKFPHARETRVVEPLGLFAVREEALAPLLERLGIMQAQNLDIGD